MDSNKNCPVMEYEDCVKYIVEKTKLDKDIVESVLNVETDFMIELGITATDKE